MLSKKWLFTILLFSLGLAPLEATKYFFEYQGKKFEITLEGLKKSTFLSLLLEEYESDDETDSEYDKFHDNDGNVKIPLDPYLKKIKSLNGNSLSDLVKPNDIECFVELSDNTHKKCGFPKKLDLKKIIVQCSLADAFGNTTILKSSAHALTDTIKNKNEQQEFLNGKGFIPVFLDKILDKLPMNITEHVLKKKILNNMKAPQKIIGQNRWFFNDVAWSTDGKLASCQTNGDINIWDEKGEFEKKLKNNKKNIIKLAWSPNGKQLASLSKNKGVFLWNLLDVNRPIKKYLGQSYHIAWSPNGLYIALITPAEKGKRVLLWDLKTDGFEELDHQTGIPETLAWSQDSKSIAVGLQNGSIKIICPQNDILKKILNGYKHPITHIAWPRNNNNNNLISRAETGLVLLWNLKTGHSTKIADDSYRITISPDDKQIAFFSIFDEKISIWNEMTKQLRKLDNQIDKFKTFAWSPDGNRLAISQGETLLILFPNFMDKTTLKQTIVICALQARYNGLNKKIAFDVTKNKEILKIVKTIPPETISLMETFGWISASWTKKAF